MLDIITIGSATIDTFITTDVKTLKIKTKKDNQEYIALPYGSKILINTLHHHTGGGGTNTATTFAKAGLKTGFFGNIGIDHNGEKILKELKLSKIKFLGKVHGKTGQSTIIDVDQDRTILTYKGCNDKSPLKSKKVKKLRTKWLYIASVTEKIFSLTKEIVKFPKNNKIKVCFNPSSYMAKKGLKYISAILKNTYCLILNNEEAELLTGHKGIKENLKTLSGKIIFDGIVVITAGKNKAYAYDSTKIYSIKPKDNIKIKETTGAGDAFASAFVLGLIKKQSIPTCMKMGMINSEHTIQHLGAKEGLLGNNLLHLANLDKRIVK